jgi:hypothetical protein
LAFHAGTGPLIGQIRMAIYTDSGSNVPQHLIVESDPFTPVADSWNAVDIPDVYLTPAVYWVSVMFSNTNSNISQTYSPGTGMLYFLSDMSWGEFPDTFPGGGSSNSNEISMYMNVCP